MSVNPFVPWIMLVTLEAHAGVHVLGGQRREGAVGIGVVLNEDVVPNLDAAGVALLTRRAPDFCASMSVATGPGRRSTCIDADGVALAAIQGLNQKL